MNNENIKPKIGIVFFVARWIEGVVSGNDASAKKFLDVLNSEEKKIIDRLSENFEIIKTDSVSSMDSAQLVSKNLMTEDIDCLLLCFIVWAEDEYLLPFRDLLKIKPAIVWAYAPYTRAPSKSDLMTLLLNSGMVGTFISFGVFRKMEVKPVLVSGTPDENKPYEEIRKIGRAAKVLRNLKTAKLGLLPYRNELMIVTYIDEFRLYSQLGPVIEYISVLQLKKAIESVSGLEVNAFIEKIKNKFLLDNRVSDKNLYKSAEASLGLEKIIFNRNFDGLALNDLNDELHEVIGLRPCLYSEKLASSDKIIGFEGDLGCTTAMYILRNLAEKKVMFSEIFNYDRFDNTIVAGHAGPSNYLLAEDQNKITITPDFEFMDTDTKLPGTWMQFIGKPGKVTMLNIINVPGNFQFTVLNGESLGGQFRLEGYPHYYIKIEPKIDDFIRSVASSGISHHWAIVNEDVKEELNYLADMLQVEKVIL